MTQPADRAWFVIIGGSIIFELASNDLLSESSQRFCVKHPIWARFAILAIAGHLAGVLPSHIDLFNAKNVFHKSIVLGYGMTRLPSLRRRRKRAMV